ncbi:Peptidyl-prolyl cis-trans isomerase [Sandaracinus amylolyticus]|uniref:peptidylprolyl isomerase n=2 Tax=Sandaracinus amylolyticus TaxID=927083 RepID=A0A0F6WAA7_9BACT|nr:Peptidyl-prolyl cis-trans isomerase [Sandaracinus amylolyticus]
MKLRLTPLALLALLAGCSSPATDAPSAPSPPSAPVASAPSSSEPSRSVLLAEADARRLSPTLTAALASPDAETRAASTLSLGRLHDPAAFPLLARALRDPAPEVRDAASLGVGALEDAAPDAASAALLGALATEADPAIRAHQLFDLGRLATDEALAALPAALASEHPVEREAACLGLANAALRGRVPDASLLRRAATRIPDDASSRVRLACAHALSRVAPAPDPADATAIGDELARGLDDADADVRAMSARALARHPGSSLARLTAATEDPDWTVAVHALRALARRAHADHAEPAYAAQIRALLDRLLASGDVAPGPPLHVFLTALDVPAPMARHGAIHTVAADALARLAAVPPDVPATRDRGLAHCAVARLVDLGRGWPARVDTCGLEQVADHERQVLAAEVLTAVEGSEAQRGVYLQRLLRHEHARVRQAAVTGMGALDTREALAALLATLRDDEDAGVTNAALEALRAAGSRRASRLAAMVLAGDTADDGWPAAAVLAALRTALARVRAADDLEGLVTWIATARELSARELASDARPLARHANLAVRRAALELLAEAGVAPPDGEPAAPPRPLDAPSIAAAPQGRVVLDTDRGEVVIELWTDRAPTTVARFVELVRAGFYDGLTFHRVVPAFVVQGGDPRGDGYGGPGWSQRCEDHRATYDRGVVGMALAGRDTGGSQFFITHSPQPHLDARYTAFGRVTSGMDAVDRIQPGDHIRRARFEQ